MSDTHTPIAPTASHVRLGSNAGQPMTRRDGVAKVTGSAVYAADNRPEGLLHAVFASAGIARGRVTRLDVDAAKSHPGVVEILTPQNRPPLQIDPDAKPHAFSWRIEALQDDTVRYAGQPIALVVAETLEAATEGARLLAPTYEEEPARIGFDSGALYEPSAVGIGAAPSFTKGDIDAGHAAAEYSTETSIETPIQYHNAMEPHAIVAEWNGDRLTLDTPNQAIIMARGMFAGYFGVPPENVTLRSPYLGGGFGSKAIPIGPQLLAIMAARMLQRPVKLALRRDQMFGPVQHRGATRQTLKLGTDVDGRLTALEHHSTGMTSSFDEFIEPAANASLNMYASPAIATRHKAVRADIGTPGPMRAPGEASGSAALECAMDIAAEAAGLDPLEFRLRNYAETDPASGKPFSSKALRECYAAAAKHFGWASRPLAPGQMRDDAGRFVGWGMGSCLFPNPMFPAQARAVLRRDGTALLETAGADMGQGAWTALAQIAADSLGLPLDRVEFRAGHSALPSGGVAGGSGHTATAGGALHAAGGDVLRQLGEIASADPDSPLFGAGNAGFVARDGRLYVDGDDSRSDSFADIFARNGSAEVTGEGSASRAAEHAERFAMYSHGAVFAEVKVDPSLGQVRVTRMVGAFAAGRIINPKLAESQLMGGMIWGLSFALHEAAKQDPRRGHIVNADFGGYHVPVNADVQGLEVITVHEEDPFVNPLGIKGVGEIGITGTVGAIGNAIRHATGRRIRSYPIRVRDLVGAGD